MRIINRLAVGGTITTGGNMENPNNTSMLNMSGFSGGNKSFQKITGGSDNLDMCMT